jgi:prepilin-type N-terminal cleavage/methylation domain-containing protein
MNLPQKKGFTLSEILITLTVLGTLAVLILPGLIKDSTSKAQVALLQSTISNLDTAIQNELINKRATTVKDTDIYSNPLAFLKTLDVSSTSTAGTPTGYFGAAYKNINGGDNGTVHTPYMAKLKNGAAIGLYPQFRNRKSTLLVIDINGELEPNIVGIDYFGLEIIWENNLVEGIHAGDIGAFLASDYSDDTISTIKTKCKAGSSDACYYALEQSGFDYNYLTQEEDN